MTVFDEGGRVRTHEEIVNQAQQSLADAQAEERMLARKLWSATLNQQRQWFQDELKLATAQTNQRIADMQVRLDTVIRNRARADLERDEQAKLYNGWHEGRVNDLEYNQSRHALWLVILGLLTVLNFAGVYFWGA